LEGRLCATPKPGEQLAAPKSGGSAFLSSPPLCYHLVWLAEGSLSTPKAK